MKEGFRKTCLGKSSLRRSLLHPKKRRPWIVLSVVWLPWLALGLAGMGTIGMIRLSHQVSVSHSTTLPNYVDSIRQQPKQSATFVVDVVSSGSESRPAYHEMQRKAFTSHPAVRHFYGLTEKNDTESTCHSDLIMNRIKDALMFCRRRPTNHTYLDSIRQYFGMVDKGNLRQMEVERARGWLCAQKRPMDGLVLAMKSYRSGTTPLPDYLIFMDDDTWMNMTKVTEYLSQNHPSNKPCVVTGCLIWMDAENRTWSWSWGGYGVFFSRATLKRLLKPIYCENAAEDSFVTQVCRRLEENQIGENASFRPGMSIADLMERYTFRHAFQDVKNWTDVGFCLHSDHIWTYFANYYFLSASNPVVTYSQAEEDRIYAYNESRYYPKKWLKNPDREMGECLHRDDDAACTADSHMCHRISASRMAELWHIPLTGDDRTKEIVR
eukprot:scaffold637_cov217-Amphora_coffeaeformis.AAC.1